MGCSSTTVAWHLLERCAPQRRNMVTTTHTNQFVTIAITELKRLVATRSEGVHIRNHDKQSARIDKEVGILPKDYKKKFARRRLKKP